jgi:uncharacterized protein YciI
VTDSKVRIIAVFVVLSLAPIPCPLSAGSRVVDRKVGNGATAQGARKYMLSLYIKGSMRLAGPLTDNAGGAVLLEVSNEVEATAIVTNDPAVKSGVFVYEMHPWKLQPWEELSKKAKVPRTKIGP